MSDYQKILVAIDLSDDSAAICKKAIHLASHEQAKLSFIHVVEFAYQIGVPYEPMLFPPTREFPIDEKELIKTAAEKLEELLAGLDCSEARHEVLSGLPKSEILQYAKKNQIDLIVCGSHGKSGFELLLGSTANAVLHHADCDVLAVRTKND